MASHIAFYLSATIAIISTAMAISRKNAVHALLYLVVSFLAVAVLLFIWGAPFLAALEVIIYAGAIMVLFVFVVMLLKIGPAAVEQERKWLVPTTWIGPLILCLVLAIEFFYILLTRDGTNFIVNSMHPRQVGESLFGTYLLAVELASFLLLTGIVGALHLGRGKTHVTHRFLQGEDKK
jgi:NADH-quinone oxidoreductase subunit J